MTRRQRVKRRWELEGQGASGELLARYDAGADLWALPRDGRFWSAVDVARRVGRRGQGRTIAIIDGSVDASIPRLAERAVIHSVADAPSDEPTDHGTVVSLLASTVAPDADLEIYETYRLGRPDRSSVKQALAAVGESNADIVALSFGSAEPTVELWASRDEFLREHPTRGPSRKWFDDDCPLCRWTTNVAEAGKMVVAAGGNDAGSIFCPARAASVISTGFSVENRFLVHGDREFSSSEPTDAFSSSIFIDFTLGQFPGALGTSYAAPLFAGFLALCEDLGIISDFIEARHVASTAESYHREANEGVSTILPQWALDTFAAALKLSPHSHSASDGPSPCPECTLFCEDLYVNYGLSLMEQRRGREAEELLRTASMLTPVSPHAFANLGVLYHNRALAAFRASPSDNAGLALGYLNDSHRCLDQAIALRPFGPYYRRREQVIEFEDHLFGDIQRLLRIGQLLDAPATSLGLEDVLEIMQSLIRLDPIVTPAGLQQRVIELLTWIQSGQSPYAARVLREYDVEAFISAWLSRSVERNRGPGHGNADPMTSSE